MQLLRGQGVHCARVCGTRAARRSATGEILRFLEEKTGVDPEMLPRTRSRSRVLGKDLFLEQEQVFAWPDKKAAETGAQFCFGLRDQLGVLSDGTVVPCCLDHEGDVPLGNLFETPLTEILASPRARRCTTGFPVAPRWKNCAAARLRHRFNR